MNAGLFNLLFFTPKNGRIEYVQQVAHKVVEKYPSRLIFITEDLSAPPSLLEAKASTIPSGQTGIVCDLLEITLSKENKAKVPFLILPHLATDLPIYAIWADDPIKNDPLLHTLETLADRLIFDSECSANLPQFARTLLRLSKTCAVADLNWARIESWRQLLASTFHSKERLEELRTAKTLQIFYNGKSSTEALYLQNWLTAQLEWDPKSVQISLCPESYANIREGAIISLELITAGETHFAFGRDLQKPHQISMRFSTPTQCTIPLKYLFEKAESGQSLVKEISHKGTSAHFLRMLHLLEQP